MPALRLTPQRPVTPYGLLAGLFLVLALSGAPVRAQMNAPPEDIWETIRTLADSLAASPGTAIESPPPYWHLDAAIQFRMAEGLERLVAGEDAGAAWEECRTAARLADDLFDTRFLRDHVEWAASLGPDEARLVLDADSLLAAGRQLGNEGETEAARETLEHARDLYVQLGDERKLPWAELGLLDPGLSGLDPDARYEALLHKGAELTEAGHLWIASNAYYRNIHYDTQLQRDDRVEPNARAMIALGERMHDSGTLGSGLHALSKSYRRRQDFQTAHQLLDRCLELTVANGDSLGIGNVYYELADAFSDEGLLDSSRVYMEKSLDIYEKLGAKNRLLSSCYGLCLDLWYQADNETALRYCERAIDVAREVGHGWVERNATNIIGNIVAHGDPERGIEWFERAQALAEEAGDNVLRVYTIGNIGLSLVDQGRMEEAREHFLHAVALADSLEPHEADDWDLKGGSLANLSWFEGMQGDTEEALRLAREAVTMADSVRHGDLGFAEGGAQLGFLLLQSGKPEEAVPVYERVIDAAQRRGDRRNLWRGHWGMAEAAWRLGREDEALRQLDESIEQMEAYREGFGSLSLRQRWFGSELWAFESMIAHRIERGEHGEALEYLERMKSRELLDLLASEVAVSDEVLSVEQRRENRRLVNHVEELNRRRAFEGEDVDDELREARRELDEFEERLYRTVPDLRDRRGQGRTLTAREARRILGPDEIALMYSLGPEEAFLLAVTRREERGVHLDAGSERIRRLVEKCVRSARSPSITGDFDRAAARELYGILVGSAGDLLEGKTRICFVPDAELYALPLAALVDPSTDSFLVERYAMYVVPSLSTLGNLRLKGSRGRRDLLALGDPDFGGAPTTPKWQVVALRSGHQRLPFTAQEVASIAEGYQPRALVLTGRQATESAFKTLAPQYGVIHVASHGILDDANPLYSSIALSANDPDEDSHLEAREVMQLQLDADIAILSACDTARGRMTRGEGINGLLRSFFIAGVPTVVASLWPVQDRPTASLMGDFHRSLRDGERPATALARAQRAMIANEATRHPFYWSAFAVYGDSE